MARRYCRSKRLQSKKTLSNYKKRAIIFVIENLAAKDKRAVKGESPKEQKTPRVIAKTDYPLTLTAGMGKVDWDNPNLLCRVRFFMRVK